jgi:hypothetical protein
MLAFTTVLFTPSILIDSSYVVLRHLLYDLPHLRFRPGKAANASAAGDDNLAIVTTHRITSS